MQYKDFDALFKKQVYNLTYSEGLNLVIDVCKRLYLDYEKFVSEEKSGDKDLLIDAIQLCEKAKSQLVDKNILEGMLIKVDPVIPDTEYFGNYLSSYTLNAAASVYETLQFIIDKDPLHVFNIGTYLTVTTDFKNDENLKLKTSEEQIGELPTMVETKNFLLKKSSGHLTTSASQKSRRKY